MTEQSNPRKIVQNGSSLAVNIPPALLDDVDLGKGDRVVLESDGESIEMEEVVIRRSADE